MALSDLVKTVSSCSISIVSSPRPYTPENRVWGTRLVSVIACIVPSLRILHVIVMSKYVIHAVPIMTSTKDHVIIILKMPNHWQRPGPYNSEWAIAIFFLACNVSIDRSESVWYTVEQYDEGPGRGPGRNVHTRWQWASSSNLLISNHHRSVLNI